MSFIKGHYGCECHSFRSWEECKKFHNQKLQVGQKVKHRCNGRTGVVCSVSGGGFVVVRCGDLERHKEQMHVANLILVTNQLMLF